MWNGTHTSWAPTMCKLLCWVWHIFSQRIFPIPYEVWVSIPILQKRNLTIFIWKAYAPTLNNLYFKTSLLSNPSHPSLCPFLLSRWPCLLFTWETRSQIGIPTISWDQIYRSTCNVPIFSFPPVTVEWVSFLLWKASPTCTLDYLLSCLPRDLTCYWLFPFSPVTSTSPTLPLTF